MSPTTSVIFFFFLMTFDITRAYLAKKKKRNIRVSSSRYDDCTSYTQIRKGRGKQISVFDPHMSQIILRECTVSSNERLHNFPMHITRNETPTFTYVKNIRALSRICNLRNTRVYFYILKRKKKKEKGKLAQSHSTFN